MTAGTMKSGYLVLSAFAFSLMGLFVKLAGQRLPSQEIVLVRAVIALVLSVLFLRWARVPLRGRHEGLLVLRGVFGFAALSCFFYALVHLPLAEATVIQYMNPIFTAVLAALFLGERAAPRLVVAIVCGFAGVLLIARPALLFGTASQPLPPTVVLVAFAGAFLSACAYVVVRRLSRLEHALVIVLYFPLVAVPAAVPGVVASERATWPDGREWLFLLGVGVTAQLAQVWLTEGMKRMPAASAAAVLYLQIVFAAAWGALFLGELPDGWTAAGALLILLGTVAAAGDKSKPTTPAASAPLPQTAAGREGVSP